MYIIDRTTFLYRVTENINVATGAVFTVATCEGILRGFFKK
jgi:hypothetical protein